MIIKRLILHNFGVYEGTNTFEFHGDKPIVLIGGQNGHGKTTFLNAVLIALYGSNSFMYAESHYKTYGQYLRSFVNETDGSKIASLSLEFQIDALDEECYRIEREWNSSGQRTGEKVKAYKNGELNKFLTENWPMFIENILPSGLSNFFFFDGEKIAELAIEKTDQHMKDSIKALLGISVLDQLEIDLKRIATQNKKKDQEKSDERELENLREAKECAEKNLAELDRNINELEENIHMLQRKLAAFKDEYVKQGGEVIAQQQELIEQRNKYKTQSDYMKESLQDMAASALPLSLVRPLLKNVQIRADQEYKVKTDLLAIEKIRDYFQQFSTECGQKSEDITRFMEFVKEKSVGTSFDEQINISDTARILINDLLSNSLNVNVKKTKDLITELDQIAARLDEVESYLAVDVNEKAVAKIYRQIKEIEQQIIDNEVSLETLRKNRSGLNGAVINANNEFNRMVETVLQQMELNDDKERISKYSQIAMRVLDEYKIELQARKASQVAETMTECYRQLASKKNLVDCIKMDAATLNLTYLNIDGKEVPWESLSAGETQLMVISLLWALAKCSRKKLPMIIDTPLSRLDSQHRESIIRNYFPYASEQTIILSTDSEIDKHYYEIMKENISDEFTLTYDDISRSTKIQRGYFAEEV